MILNRFAFILSVFGAVVAAYMWSMHSHPQDIPCGLHSNECLQVALSPYSRFPEGSGPPVAMWGLFGYLMLIGLTFLRTAVDDPKRNRQLLGLALLTATVGMVASLRLTYLEIYVIRAICKWCMTSQGIMAGVFILLLTDWLRPLIGGAPKKL